MKFTIRQLVSLVVAFGVGLGVTRFAERMEPNDTETLMTRVDKLTTSCEKLAESVHTMEQRIRRIERNFDLYTRQLAHQNQLHKQTLAKLGQN